MIKKKENKNKLSLLKITWTYLKDKRIHYVCAIFAIGLATLASYATPLIIKNAIDGIIGNNINLIPKIAFHLTAIPARLLLYYGLLIVSVTLLSGFFSYIKGAWSAKAAENFALKIRDALYYHIQLLPFSYHVKAETGDLIQRCTSDVDTVRRFLAVQFVEIGRAFFMLGIALPIMLKLNVKLTIASMGAIPILFLFSYIFYSQIQKNFLASDEAEGALSNTLQENLTGVRIVRAFAREKYEIEKFDKKNANYTALTYKLIKLLGYYWSLSDFIAMMQISIVIVAGTYMAIHKEITLGSFVVFLSYVNMILWPVRQLGRILTDLGKSLVSLQRIHEIFSQQPEKLYENGITPDLKGDIVFENVTFSYDEHRTILKSISFTVKQGQTVAILGPTGSGKTTLVHLLPRLFEYNGSIKINGHELNSIDKAWVRSNIGVVLQEPFLFSKTIKENISLAKNNASKEEISLYAYIASIHDDVIRFEQGYDTAVGEKGVTLSGGQKQRIAIARTLIKNSPVLIFDDSLSAVDTETDVAIRNRLKDKIKATTFIISHRIFTLKEADIILVIENGEITQFGNHNELVKQKGLYQRIYNIQNSLEEEMKKIK